MTSATQELAQADLKIEEIRNLYPDITSLLEKVVWGTEGARYKLVDIGPTLAHLPHPTYITLKLGGHLIGLRLYLEKGAKFGNQTLHSFYHSYFAIDPAYKGKGFGKKLACSTVNILRQKIARRGLIYCHVETENLRSLKIAESLGYRNVGRFAAMSFSRFFPKSSPRLRKMTTSEKPVVLRLLADQYRDHALTDFPESLSPESFYVLADENHLLAGLQMEPQHWKILSLAGTDGKIALYVLPHLPLMRDLFNPQRFEFLKIGNVFFEQGHPEYAFELMEAVLVEHHRKTLMMFWDKGSPVFQELSKAGPFGVLNALTETPVEVMALFEGMNDQEISDFSSRPKVISPSDL